MNKKLLFVFLVLLFVTPVFVAANPFWDLLTGYTTYSNRVKVNINTYKLHSGTNTIRVTVSGERAEQVLINIKTPASWFGKYVVRNGKMNCVSNKCYTPNCKPTSICTYKIRVTNSWARSARIYVKAQGNKGRYRYAYKTVRVDLSPLTYCADTDGGKNYDTKGSVSDSQGIHRDYCYSSKGLKEYYCLNNRASYVYHYCSYGCSNGACKKSPVSSCRDSDGGRNYYAAGSVSYTGSNGVVSFSKDYCSGNYLTEYYCSGNKVSSTRHYCSYGCSNGACKNETQTICHAGDWKCDSNWPKYAYACVDNQWINIGEVPPAPPNGAWVCDKTTGKLTIQKFIPIKSVEERAYCNYNNNPWRCKLSDWPGKAYFCVNHKWMKIDIPPAPPQSRYVCQNNEVKIVS